MGGVIVDTQVNAAIETSGHLQHPGIAYRHCFSQTIVPLRTAHRSGKENDTHGDQQNGENARTRQPAWMRLRCEEPTNAEQNDRRQQGSR